MVEVHPNALKHGLSEEEIVHAWENYIVGAVRVPGEVEVRIGIDLCGREVELIGAVLANGDWLVFHAIRPPTKKVCDEIEKARRRR